MPLFEKLANELRDNANMLEDPNCEELWAIPDALRAVAKKLDDELSVTKKNLVNLADYRL